MKLLGALALLVCAGCSAADKVSIAEPLKTRSIIRYESIHHPVTSQRGMVVSQNGVATSIGTDILEKGGNAIDAAVATGLVLAVTLPRAGNIGGSGFMLIHLADSNRTIALDYYSAAPSAANRDVFKTDSGVVDRLRRYSYLGPAIPGTIAGFHHALENYGSMTWQEVAQPAIDLARNGVVVTDDLYYALMSKREVLYRDPESRSVFFKADGSLLSPGERIVYSDLADTLEQIAKKGMDAFYKGDIAKKIDTAMVANGGFIRKADLANYQVNETDPIWCAYREYDIAFMVPPSSGVYTCELLKIIENFPVREMGVQSAALYHVLAESMKMVFADRSKFTGGTPQYQMPVAQLTDKAYTRRLAATILPDRAKPYAMIEPGTFAAYEESRDTTHYSIADRHGNIVSNTYTLGSSFGSGVTVPDTGILLNDHIANFALSVGVSGVTGFQANPNNRLEDGKRAVSTISPVIVFKNGAPYLVTGSPGGTRIITSVAQLIIALVDLDMDIAQATNLPRMHQEWSIGGSGVLEVEAGHSVDTIRILRELGHKVQKAPTIGSTQSILIREGLFHGAADPRRPGALAMGVN